MSALDLRKEIGRFDLEIPIEGAWTPPASWYTSPEIFALEKRAVFRRSWQPLARTADLQEPGSFASGCFLGEPWLVVRSEDGALRAFHNACRHKGREVVQGTGRAESLVCGYHAWRYGLDGRLQSAPRMAGIRDFDRSAMSLVPLPTAVWGPWVFASFSSVEEAAELPLGERVAPLDIRLAATEWQGLRYAGSKSWTIACNWKVYVDNYLDGGYHIPHMHPTLDAQIDMRTYRTDLFEHLSIQSAAPAASRDQRLDYDPAARIGGEAVYAWIYPNFMINRYGPCMDTNHVVPLDHERCRVDYEFWFVDPHGPAGAEFVRRSIEQSDATQHEDIAICQSVQVGLRSSSYDRGRYAPEVETGEHHFHRMLGRELGEGLERSVSA